MHASTPAGAGCPYLILLADGTADVGEERHLQTVLLDELSVVDVLFTKWAPDIESAA